MARDDEQVWAEIVENFHSSTGSERPQWPAAENVDAEAADSSMADGDASAGRGDSPAGSGDAGAGKDGDALAGQDGRPTTHRPSDHDQEAHFVPPSPPPLPRTDLITRLAWLCVLGTPVFFLLAVIVGRPVSGLLGALGAGAFIGGFVLLVLRLRGHDPYDPDDGAVV